MKKNRRHFESLDALRFFAFFKVFLLHIPITFFPLLNFFRAGGEIGVSLFFVLSGFLITFIILEEKEATGKLNLSSFFMRRILRIWPLYYLMVAVAFFTPYFLSKLHIVYSNAGYAPNWLWTMTFLENYQMIATNSFPNVSPLRVMWSLCVEEHFYILWGVLLWKVTVKKLPLVIASAIILSIVSRFVFISRGWQTIDLLTNIDLFAYGAIPAFLLIRHKETFEIKLQNIPIFVKRLAVCLIVVSVLIHSNITYSLKTHFEPIVIGLLFSMLICLTIPKKNAIYLSASNIFSQLGKYTYGLYLIHILVLNLLLQVFKMRQLTLDLWQNALLFIFCSFSLSVVLAIASYHFFELPFLKLKRFFYKTNEGKPVSALAGTTK